MRALYRKPNFTVLKNILLSHRFVSINDVADPTYAEIARVIFLNKEPMTIPMLISALSSSSKDKIFKSGIGVEGFLKAGSPVINIIDQKGIKKVDTTVSSINSETDEVEKRFLRERLQPVRFNEAKKRPPETLLFLPLDDINQLRIVAKQRCLTEEKFINEIYQLTHSQVSYDRFYRYVCSCGEYIVNGNKMMCKKENEVTEDNLKSPQSSTKKRNDLSSEKDVITVSDVISSLRNKTPPMASNNWGGWGHHTQIPTEEDVFEILRYIPVQWTNFGSLNIPTSVKKKYIRVASVVQWFRRQPKYFEVRNVAGTLEIRRSVLLHPEQNNMTIDEAVEYIRSKVSTGELNSINMATEVGSQSVAATNIYKFLVRIVPGYFVSPELVFMRYTKKNLLITEMMQVAREHPTVFEILRYNNGVQLLRRRTGSDSSRWLESFTQDLESIPEDFDALIALMGRSTVLWDRPEYLYVRLLENERVLVGGYENMLEIMKRHPKIFCLGQQFFKRVDLSDPVYLNEPEPTGAELTPRNVEENVYVGIRDIDVIFHYVAPDVGPVNIAQLHEACSPAMRPCLPPHLITVLQVAPDLFNCAETAPGVFSVRKLHPPGFSVAKTLSGISGKGDTTLGRSSSDGLMDADDTMDKKETVEVIKSLIPAKGVDMVELESWMSLPLKRNVEKYYQTLSNLINQEKSLVKDFKGLIKVKTN